MFLFFQAELADVLRKRRNRPSNNNISDEDIQFTGSQLNTPLHKQHSIINNNQSEGSSSLISMTTSSDMDEESSSGIGVGGGVGGSSGTGGGISTLNSTLSSNNNNNNTKLLDTSKSFDEIDLDLSFTTIGGTQLSHSAARHKMAVRPKKKGPSTRARRQIDVSICYIDFIYIYIMVYLII